MSIDKPAISVVMPVFNGEKYLKEAVDSVINQTFNDFEFIIVNDGSTDRSEEIILSYNDKRIKYIKQNNTGIGGALKNGCNIALGKYIARMDADDVCLPERFEVQFDFLEKKSTTVLVSNSVLYIDENSEIFGRSFSPTANRAIRNKLKKGSVICHPSVMMRNDIYKKTGGYQDLQPLEDYSLWVRMSRYGKFHNLAYPLLKYRVLNTSISRSISESNYKELIQYIKKRDFVITDQDLTIFQHKYTNAKKEFINNTNPNSIAKIELNNPIELKLLKTLKNWGFDDKFIEFFICNIKTLIYILW
jgi:glycosyltransferase involved in cell wall biosynthesis